MKRPIVHIDEEKCNGCGQCVPACAEGAIQVVDGKARLVADNLCDGLGACLGDCPQDAITLIERDAASFDEEAVENRLHGTKADQASSTAATGQGGCPSAQVKRFSGKSGGGCPGSQVRTQPAKEDEETATSRPSQLRQWPVLLHLVPPHAPFLDGADLLLAADCTAFSYGDFHDRLLKDRVLLVGCPKFDDADAYVDKLTAILQQNDIKSLTVARMEVPCCSGMTAIAEQALARCDQQVPHNEVVIGLQGEVK